MQKPSTKSSAGMESRMKKRKRYTWFYIVIVLLVFYISFFYMERTEISDVDILLVVGIDKAADGYHVSGLYNRNGGVDEAIGGTKLIDGIGDTFYAAYNDLVQKNMKSVSIAHTTFYIFSEQAARSGMSQCLDYIERDQTVKMNAMIYLLKGSSVKDFMQKSIEKKTQFNDQLKAISEKQFDEKKLVDNTVNKVTEALEENYDNLFIPYLVSENDNLYVNGYGIIKKDALVAYLDRQQSLTLDFLRNRTRTYPIYLENQVGLEITESQVRSDVEIVNGSLVVTMNALFESDIKEVASTDHVYEDYYVNQLENLQNQYMANQLKDLIQVAEDYNLDLVDAAGKIRTTYVKDWETISENWNYYFSNISYQFNIKSQAAQSYVVAN